MPLVNKFRYTLLHACATSIPGSCCIYMGLVHQSVGRGDSHGSPDGRRGGRVGGGVTAGNGGSIGGSGVAGQVDYSLLYF
jgi:hypothetical protein